MALTGKQRQFLRGLAHALEPVVRVGRAGASPSVIEETKRSLNAHELIKVRIDHDHSSERKALAEQYATHAVALLGRLRDQGYFKEATHAKTLATDLDLQVLRNRADFQKLLPKNGASPCPSPDGSAA